MTEIAQKYDVHLNQLTEWRRQLNERAAGAFGGTMALQASPVNVKERKEGSTERLGVGLY